MELRLRNGPNGRRPHSEDVMPVVNEYTRECLALEAERSITATKDVIKTLLAALFELRGEPAFIRSDNGPEVIAEAVKSCGSQPQESRRSTSKLVLPGRTPTQRRSSISQPLFRRATKEGGIHEPPPGGEGLGRGVQRNHYNDRAGRTAL